MTHSSTDSMADLSVSSWEDFFRSSGRDNSERLINKMRDDVNIANIAFHQVFCKGSSTRSAPFQGAAATPSDTVIVQGQQVSAIATPIAGATIADVKLDDASDAGTPSTSEKPPSPSLPKPPAAGPPAQLIAQAIIDAREQGRQEILTSPTVTVSKTRLVAPPTPKPKEWVHIPHVVAPAHVPKVVPPAKWWPMDGGVVLGKVRPPHGVRRPKPPPIVVKPPARFKEQHPFRAPRRRSAADAAGNEPATDGSAHGDASVEDLENQEVDMAEVSDGFDDQEPWEEVPYDANDESNPDLCAG